MPSEGTITCPLCQSPDIDLTLDVPNLTLYKCRKCSTAFSITPKPPSPPSS